MLSDARKKELEMKLVEMQRASDTFYATAVRLGTHTFIEQCGLMNKFIDLCRAALREGIDFDFASRHCGDSLPMKDHDAYYLGEKVGCMFPTLINHMDAFKRGLDDER